MNAIATPVQDYQSFLKYVRNVPAEHITPYLAKEGEHAHTYHLRVNPGWYVKRATEVCGECGIGWGYSIADYAITRINGEQIVTVHGEIWCAFGGDTMRIPAIGTASVLKGEDYFDAGRFAIESLLEYGLKHLGFASALPGSILSALDELRAQDLYDQKVQGVVKREYNKGLNKAHRARVKQMMMPPAYARLTGSCGSNVMADSSWFQQGAIRVYGPMGNNWSYQVKENQFNHQQKVHVIQGVLHRDIAGIKYEIPSLAIRSTEDSSRDRLLQLPATQLTASMNNALRNVGFGHNRELLRSHTEVQMLMESGINEHCMADCSPSETFTAHAIEDWFQHPLIIKELPALKATQKKAALYVVKRIIAVADTDSASAIAHMILDALKEELSLS